MSKPIKQTSQAAFTLVELAIVMIIIGLLIAGVLKGQELIGNARVTSTVAQIKAIDAGVSTFKDTYAALPGDITTPNTRLPNCTAAENCSLVAGNGDGILGTVAAPLAFGAAPTLASEQGEFFPQMNAANLLTGIAPANGLTFGGVFPQAKIDGVGLVAGSVPAPSAAAMPSNLATTIGTVPSGLFLSLTSSATAASGAATLGLTPSQASRINLKLDDGNPTSGAVIGFGTAACGTAAGGYITSTTSNLCGLYVNIQG
jgi:prepilin-type N-terminal cleavage/methylation domain-containing protein